PLGNSGLGHGFRSRRGSRLGAVPYQAKSFAQSGVQLRPDVGVIAQKLTSVLATLANPLALVAVPGAGFFDQVLSDAEVDQVALLRNAFAVNDVELGFAERRRYLVFDHLDFRAAAGYD